MLCTFPFYNNLSLILFIVTIDIVFTSSIIIAKTPFPRLLFTVFEMAFLLLIKIYSVSIFIYPETLFAVNIGLS